MYDLVIRVIHFMTIVHEFVGSTQFHYSKISFQLIVHMEIGSKFNLSRIMS